ncbi:MAG TPA: bifunctional phosphoribosylaminoimidazolecarboxamide formyltransferase/IMP cyclohydrolase [Dehalococcoidia bacterium]|nr:bifunctional phosphoribosylaminoimidazolecarboxamide formyltransferase/IMP cyclohydrolase [Dehalococcoidia bacterium]HIK90151.1 bifunctional phosphoribosylaminoimidazolecarboxamide formyltransferase/IMP cyclohydrolase [Dehalococcoidia bacterium]
MRALLSAYDRTGLVDFAKTLVEAGFELLSTGGTANELKNAGLDITEVASVTGAPEILDGRVKTLHPRIHGGLLGKRSNPAHVAEMKKQGIEGIDVVVNNLYPFQQTISKPDVSLDDALENIDIGGPAMTRAAAKNFPDVVIVVDPSDYATVGEMIVNGGVSMDQRRRLAAKAFQHVAGYDTLISAYLREPDATGDDKTALFPEEITFGWNRVAIPRYGENPHQAGGIYVTPGETGGIVNAKQLHGIDMSYLNYFDADAAWVSANSYQSLGQHCVSVVKHANPCGLAINADQTEAYRNALAGDPMSAFGGIVGFNNVVTAETATAMKGVLYDVIVAPGYEPEALEILQKRRRTRVLETKPSATPLLNVRNVTGGALIQQPDDITEVSSSWTVVTKKQPTEQQLNDMAFAWKACQLVHSNAIVFARDSMLKGMGAGQPNRVMSVYLAGRAAGDDAEGCVMASDAYFPFPDGIESAAEAGAVAIVQPGGSVKDQEVIDAADRLGLVMLFTGTRHFNH